jgi:hypothetical protein
MSIKVIIANNNDILYNSLSNIVLQNESKIEIVNVPTDKLKNITCHIKSKDNLIILDSITSVSFCSNILKNAINRIDKGNIIILVIDSKHITDIINQEKQHFPFGQKNTYFSLLDTVTLIVDSLNDTLEIEKTIDDILWKLGFTPHFKGTDYLKDAILLAYNNDDLLEDMNILVEKVAEKNNVENEKIVRSLMDKTLNNIFDSTNKSIVYEIFGNNYDGRKISLKYFVDLCIRYLDEKRYCCLD